MKHELFDNFAELLHFALSEDLGGAQDITSQLVVPEDALGTYAFVAREEMVLCGEQAILAAFPDAEVKYHDGDKVPANKEIARVTAKVRDILTKERSVLNIMQHLSGIATETAKYVAAVSGTKAKILDTRKTLPIWRILQKYAVVCGGGQNHRMGLYDMVMIKDNHIAAAGSVSAALEKVQSVKGKMKIEVECDTLDQVGEALKGGADVIMLDNMNFEQMAEAVKIVGGKAELEASGNVSLKTVADIAATGVDYISVGKLTHSVRTIDIGLDFNPQPR